MKVVQGLFFISEEAWVGENGSIEMYITSTQDYSGSYEKNESVQGVLKYNKCKIQWWEWDSCFYITKHCLDDSTLHITLSRAVVEDNILSRKELEMQNVKHPFFNELPYENVTSKEEFIKEGV